MAEEEIRDPILAAHALEEFGVGKKWLRARIKDGRIRSKKVGRNRVLERADIVRELPSEDDRDLVEQAIKRYEKRQKRSS